MLWVVSQWGQGQVGFTTDFCCLRNFNNGAAEIVAGISAASSRKRRNSGWTVAMAELTFGTLATFMKQI